MCYDGADILLALLPQGWIIEDEVGCLAGGQRKSGDDIATPYANGDVGTKREFEASSAPWLEAYLVGACPGDFMSILPVIESRATAKLVDDISPYGCDPSYQLEGRAVWFSSL